MRTKPPRPASQVRTIHLALSAALFTIAALCLLAFAGILIMVPSADYTPATHAALAIACLVMATATGFGVISGESARDNRFARAL